jgi:sulfur carrier protein
MQIICNGQSQVLDPGATIAILLGELRLSGPVAVEVNEELAPREQHDGWKLSQGDRVEVVTLVGGG